jgi:hypothetical protein
MSHQVKVKLSRYCHAGTTVERSYSYYSFFASVLDGDEWSASRPGHSLTPGKNTRYPLDRRLDGPQSWYGHRG